MAAIKEQYCQQCKKVLYSDDLKRPFRPQKQEKKWYCETSENNIDLKPNSSCIKFTAHIKKYFNYPKIIILQIKKGKNLFDDPNFNQLHNIVEETFGRFWGLYATFSLIGRQLWTHSKRMSKDKMQKK